MNTPQNPKFFQTLRGRLTLRYTLVTVLALLALECICLLGLLGFILKESGDQEQYLADIQAELSFQARRYMLPGQEDLEGLQSWLGVLYTSRQASLPAQGWLDSPAAELVQTNGIYVTRMGGFEFMACVPKDCGGSNNGIASTAYGKPYGDISWSWDWTTKNYLELLSRLDDSGNIQLAIPVTDVNQSRVYGTIYLTVKPAPELAMLGPAVWAGLKIFFASALVLLAAVAPFGALFGYLSSRKLTQRLEGLDHLAHEFGQGNFAARPNDVVKDEIGRLGQQLAQLGERIQSLLQSQHELALLEERGRLARELHDTVKQNIFAALMQIRAARNKLDGAADESVLQNLAEAEKLAQDSQQELSLLIAALRPAALEGQGLALALQAYLAGWQEQTQIQAEMKVVGERNLPLQVEQVLYRVAQEALANVARHSQASRVELQLTYQMDSIKLVCQDDGKGFDSQQPRKAGFGLESMRQRLESLGGSLIIQSEAGNGTLIEAEIRA